MMRLQLEAVDTLFFRDGTPFAAESTGPRDVGGLFPPHPGSITGALRAALARANGWSGAGRWTPELNQALGPGPDDLGLLSFDGPTLLRNGQPLFAAPLHLLGLSTEDGWTPRALLQPGSPVNCDLGPAVQLPDLPADISVAERPELKTGEGWWLTQAGLERLLQGQLPRQEDMIASDELWRQEPRIGIERDRQRRTAREGMLYSARHVRLQPGVGLGVQIHGLDANWKPPLGTTLPLGGESRMAECSHWGESRPLRMPHELIAASQRLLVVALTPLDLEPAQALGREALTDFGDARVIAACLGRPLRIGGWDSLARRPLPLQSVLPAGSVLFCSCPQAKSLIETIAAGDGQARLGRRQRWGYGAVALGTWNDPLE